MNVQFKKLTPTSQLPTYGSTSAAGLDLRANLDAPVIIEPGQKAVLIPTGIAIYLEDPTTMAAIFPRSGLGHKQGLVLGNGTGVIDADYQGELFVSVCVRPGHDRFTISNGDRIAQLVIMPVLRATLEEVEQFNVTDRGSSGFGSTGTQ